MNSAKEVHMKKVRNSKYFSLGCILAVVLLLVGFSILQAQMMVQGKGGKKPKPPPPPDYICIENDTCDYEEYVNALSHELQPCDDCLPKNYDPLYINQDTDIPAVQILGYWHENHKLFQFKFEDGVYQDTWSSFSSEDERVPGGYIGMGDPDRDGDKEIIVIKNYLINEVSTGKGKKKVVTKYYDQVASIFETSAVGIPSYITPHFGYSEGYAHPPFMADANNDGFEDELILTKSCNDDSYIHGGEYIQIFRMNDDREFLELLTSDSYDSAKLTSVSDADGDGKNEIVLRSFYGAYAIIIDHLGGDSWGNAEFTDAIPDCRLDDAMAAEADNVGTPEMPDPEIIGGGNTGQLAVWKLIDGQYEMVFLSDPELTGAMGDGYIGDIEVGDIDDDPQREVIFSYLVYGSSETIIYVCELVLTGTNPYSYFLYIESINVLDRRGLNFAIGNIDGIGKDEIIHDGRGGTIYDYDNESESLRKLYHSIFMGNTVVK